MRPYGKDTFEDPLDGPYPTKQTKWVGNKKRPALKRKMRSRKKIERQMEIDW